MLKSIITLVALSAFSAPAFAQEAFPAGLWIDQDRQVVIRMAQCQPDAAVYCGVIVRDDRPETIQNPPSHKAVTDLRAVRGAWRGRINDGGMNFGLSMRPVSADTAQVRMCFGGIACANDTWTRYNDASAPAQAGLRK
jgi:hypothetical protein